MTDLTRKSWIPVGGIIGVTYALVGIVFAMPAAHAQMWRLAAWVLSAVIYTAHICYERFRLGNPHGRTALHVEFGAAIGAFGLGVGANIHAHQIETTAQHRLLLMLSLALWPLITALPAFCVAVATSWVLMRIVRGRSDIRTE